MSPEPGFVVTEIELLGPDKLPAASRAFTVNVYGVFAASPLTVALVPETFSSLEP
ncbi:hypothetical protein D3C77_518410 [compost metagenome]